MTPEARRAFMLSGTRTAIVASARPDGRPHAVPVGFVLEGDDVVFLTNPHTVKATTVQRNPRVTLVVDDETPPFAFVMVEGVAESSRDPSEVERVAPKIGERYAGPGGVDDFVHFAREALGLVVRIKPTRIVALDRVGEH